MVPELLARGDRVAPRWYRLRLVMPDAFIAGLVVNGRDCVVLGGDREAEDKARRLVDAGARVRVVAAELTEGLAALVAQGAAAHARREPAESDADGAFLVVLAPRDEALARRLYARACAPGGYLLCAVDQPEYCTVTSVALVRRGALQLAVATGGDAPMLASRIRAAMDAQLGDDLARYVARLGALRAATAPARRRAAMTEALEGFAWTVTYVIPSGEAPAADEPERGLRRRGT